MPRRSGNHWTRVEIGEIYPIPRPIPPITPKVTRNRMRLSTATLTPAPIVPRPNRTAAVRPAKRGPYRSTKMPKKAAVIPRTKIAIVNASVTSEVVHPTVSFSGF
jgi:hypothetical protein